MNPRVVHAGIVVVTIGGIAFLAFMTFAAIFSGCAVSLPPEPPFTETVTDASRHQE